jgi:hypothetical protein
VSTALAVTETEWNAMVTVGLRAGFVLGHACQGQMQTRKIKGRMLLSLPCIHTRHGTDRIT